MLKRKSTTRGLSSKVKRKPAKKKSPVVPRKDLGMDVERWMKKLRGPTLAIVEELRALVKRAAPGASESIKWGMPVYTLNGMLCYIRPHAEYVRFGFYDQGVHLDDPAGLLEGTGINLRHTKVRSAADIHRHIFEQWVRDAVVLNGG